MQSFKDIFLQIQNSTGELKVLTENTSFYMLTNDFRILMSAAAHIKCDNFSIFDDVKVVMQTSDI
jgi:galactose-1-phosphate uridylyltransferase